MWVIVPAKPAHSRRLAQAGVNDSLADPLSLGIRIDNDIDREAVHPAVANEPSHAHDRLALVHRADRREAPTEGTMAVLGRGRRPANSAQQFDVLVGGREAFDKLDGLIIALGAVSRSWVVPERWANGMCRTPEVLVSDQG